MIKKNLVAYFLTIIYFVSSTAIAYSDSQCTDCCYESEYLYSILTASLRDAEEPMQDQDISLLSVPLINLIKTRMPSTGDVKVLVLPIDFNDERLSDELMSVWKERYFGITDEVSFDSIDKYSYGVLSMADRYKKCSFNQLRLSGTVLPIYTINGARDTYRTGRSVSAQMQEEIAKAIKSYKNIIGNLKEYDSDNDGYIDCLHVICPGTLIKDNPQPAGTLVTGGDLELYDGIKMGEIISIGANDFDNPNAYKGIATHETGHLLGLPDNYNAKNGNNILPKGVQDIMGSSGHLYFNVFYRYLLDWEKPVIIPYEDGQQEIDIYSSDKYKNNAEDEPRTVIFCPNPDNLPYGEYYIVEYRTQNNKVYNNHPGIIVWHCNLEKSQVQSGIVASDSYLKPVYKSGDDTTDFLYDDFYRTGDEWSDETTPSSKFYNDIFTGAYMKVLSMDDEKATLQVGFKDVGDITRPSVAFSEPTSKYAKQYDTVQFPFKAENYTQMNNTMSPEFITTGDVQYSYNGWRLSKGNGYVGIRINGGNGTLQVKMPDGKFTDDLGFQSRAAISPVLHVDTTPPDRDFYIFNNGKDE